MKKTRWNAQPPIRKRGTDILPKRIIDGLWMPTQKVFWILLKYFNVKFQTKSGIRCYCVDKDLNSILYSNRAAANRHLGNLRSAFRDCFFARRFNKDNFKVKRKIYSN
jgi:hypothetical protein